MKKIFYFILYFTLRCSDDFIIIPCYTIICGDFTKIKTNKTKRKTHTKLFFEILITLALS